MTTYTRYYNLTKPDFNIITWHDQVNENFDLIDGVMFSIFGFDMRGAWMNSTSYAVADRAFDLITGNLWQCAVAHTSAASGNFLDDRTANPTYWTQVLTVLGATSVNGKTGDVILDPDDLDDATTAHKFVSAAERTQIGTNQTNIAANGAAIAANGADITDLQANKAEDSEEYVVMTATAGLGNERVLTAGENITITDGGAGNAVTVDAAYPPGFIKGFEPAQEAGDPDHDIEFQKGWCRDRGNAENIVLSSSIIKWINSTWSVGSNVGGMQSGSSIPTNGTIHAYVIKRTDTGVVDVLYVPEGDAISLPTNYDRYRRIFSFRTDGSGNIVDFITEELAGGALEVKQQYENDRDADINGSLSVSLSVAHPIDDNITAIFSVMIRDTTTGECVVNDTRLSDVTPTPQTATITGNVNAQRSVTEMRLRVSPGRNVRVNTDTNLFITINTRGWVDQRTDIA